MRIRDCVWIWGHPPGKLNEPCHLDSQMTPMESALYLGARNVFYIPMGKIQKEERRCQSPCLI